LVVAALGVEQQRDEHAVEDELRISGSPRTSDQADAMRTASGPTSVTCSSAIAKT
jgi:hypothetical protein